MNINTQSINQQQSTLPDSPKTTSFEPNDKKQETVQAPGIIVDLSSAAVDISSSTKKPPSSAPINNQEQAREAVNEFKKQAANDPVLTQEIQSNSLTSEQVKILTG